VGDICANKAKPRKAHPLWPIINLALKMLDQEREWGEVSALAQEHGVSRKFLHQLPPRAANSPQYRNENSRKRTVPVSILGDANFTRTTIYDETYRQNSQPVLNPVRTTPGKVAQYG
jgi:hypothetical protein